MTVSVFRRFSKHSFSYLVQIHYLEQLAFRHLEYHLVWVLYFCPIVSVFSTADCYNDSL